MGVNSKGKKVAGDEEKGEGKPAEAVNVGSSKGGVRKSSPGDEKKDGVGQDKKESGDSAVSDNVTPVIATDNATKTVAEDGKLIPLVAATTKANCPEVPSVAVSAAPSSGTPTMTTDKKDDAAKEKTKPTINEEKVEQVLDGKTIKSKGPVVTDEGDVVTPKRVTKELPASPGKSPKEKLVPALGLTVPKNGSAPPSTTATDSTLSPLQKALANAEDETLMERVARLEIGGSGFQPQEEMTAPAHTDLESEFEGETAPSGPSTPRSKAGGSFSLILRSDVPLSDDDDFFLDCNSNASVSNFEGL